MQQAWQDMAAKAALMPARTRGLLWAALTVRMPAEALAIACIATGVLLAARPSPSLSSKGTQP